MIVLPDKQHEMQRKEREKMTNVALLEEKIKESGKKKSYLAKRLNISRAGFRNLCAGKSEFRTGQVQILCIELNITDAEEKEAIFFAPSVA